MVQLTFGWGSCASVGFWMVLDGTSAAAERSFLIMWISGSSVLLLILLMANNHVADVHSAAINNCPMQVVRQIIGRTIEAVGVEDAAATQMQIIRRIMEDIYGGNWGVLIIKEPELISTAVHWTFPDHRHRDGAAAFCLHVERGWQYNVFKTGDVDTEDRVIVDQVIEHIASLNGTARRMSSGTGGKKSAGSSSSAAQSVAPFNAMLIDRTK